VGGGLPDLDLTTLLFVLAGYLAGSIPTGYWLVRALRSEDIRKVGSGNIGATNVWRTYGARLGAIVGEEPIFAAVALGARDLRWA